jgi:hypothetical protein
MDKNTTNPGVAQGAQTGTSQQAHGATSTSHGDLSILSADELRKRLEEALSKNEELQNDNFKYRDDERTRKKQEQAAEAERQQQLAAQGKFEEIAKQATARAQELEAQLLQVQQEALRTRIAAKHGLPEGLAARLQGQTEEQMEADAVELKKFVNQKVEVSVQQGNSPNPRPTTTNTTQANVDELTQRHRLTRGNPF